MDRKCRLCNSRWPGRDFWQANLRETFQGAPRTEGGPEVGGMLITENGEHV